MRWFVSLVVCSLFLSVQGFSEALPDPGSFRSGILIEGDDGFTAENGVVAGNGSAEDPYVISGHFIVAPPTPGIYLVNTTRHVLIEDNHITGAFFGGPGYYSAGVRLDSAANVTIRSNHIDASHFGIHMRSSAHVNVLDNTVIGTQAPALPLVISNGGIQALGSRDIVVRDNVVRGFGWGIDVQNRTQDVLIVGNDVFGTTFTSGIAAHHGVARVMIVDNIVQQSASGIDVSNATDVSIIGNTVADSGRGIGAFGSGSRGPSARVQVAGNVIRDVTYGTDIAGCVGCVLTRNHFEGITDGLFLNEPVVLTHNVFRDNALVFQVGVDPDATIRDNSIDLSNDVYADVRNWVLDVRHNWWGTPDGPDMDRFEISGDGQVLVSPWLADAPDPVGRRSG